MDFNSPKFFANNPGNAVSPNFLPPKFLTMWYIVTDVDYNSGKCFNVSIMFSNVSVTIPIVHVSIVGLYYH